MTRFQAPPAPVSRAPATPPAGDRAERLVDAVLGGVTYREVIVPRTSVKGRMRLLQRGEEALVRSECRRELAERHRIAPAAPGVLESFPEWREERILRVLAIAVRDPADPSRPLAELDEWSTCDDVQLLALWDIYQDLEAELDPLGPSAPPLTAEEVGAIKSAAGKGSADLLMSFGSRRLALFVISTAAAPPS